MAETIVVPNDLFSWLKPLWNQSLNLTKLPPEVNINEGEFPTPPLTDDKKPIKDDDLLPLMQARINKWFNDNTNLVFGSPDFLPISILDKGRTASRAVCCILRCFTDDQDLDKIIDLANRNDQFCGIVIKLFSDEGNPINPVTSPNEFKKQARKKDVPCATGFLVGKNYLLTNRHVLKGQAELSNFSAAFEYEADIGDAMVYKFDHAFYKTADNLDLDYVLLKLQPFDGAKAAQKYELYDGVEAGERFNPISLATVDIVPKPTPGVLDGLSKPSKLSDEVWEDIQSKGFSGDLVNIIQHPEGRSKEMVIFNNRLTNLYNDFLVYESDAQPGSSGSPLFNAQWELIGLHRAALLSQEKGVTGYLGVRISSILADLEKQSKSDKEVQVFLDHLNPQSVNKTSQQVFILAGRDRSSILNNPDYARLEQVAMLQLQQQIEASLKRLNPAISVIKINTSEKEPDKPELYKKLLGLNEAIQTINESVKSSTTQNIAIELLTDAYDTDSVGGISIYYNGRDSKGKNYATALLKILEKDKDLPIFGVGAYSDLVTKSSRLAFCRRLNMPALVFYAGYLTNPNDLDRFKLLLNTDSSSLADGIAAGLLACLN